MKLMHERDIPDFVSEVVEAGCNITAVLGVCYVIGDADLTAREYKVAAPKLARIEKRFGERDHLFSEICEYLVSIGRTYPPTILH